MEMLVRDHGVRVGGIIVVMTREADRSDLWIRNKRLGNSLVVRVGDGSGTYRVA